VEWGEKGLEVEGLSAGVAPGQGEDAKELQRLLAQARKEVEKGGVKR
jgi:hypothetical protein